MTTEPMTKQHRRLRALEGVPDPYQQAERFYGDAVRRAVARWRDKDMERVVSAVIELLRWEQDGNHDNRRQPDPDTKAAAEIKKLIEAGSEAFRGGIPHLGEARPKNDHPPIPSLTASWSMYLREYPFPGSQFVLIRESQRPGETLASLEADETPDWLFIPLHFLHSGIGVRLTNRSSRDSLVVAIRKCFGDGFWREVASKRFDGHGGLMIREVVRLMLWRARKTRLKTRGLRRGGRPSGRKGRVR